MGLDSVEIVIRTEQTFGISISNEEAEVVRTPGMLVELIQQKVQHTNEKYCRSQRAFYLLRKTLQHELGVKRNDIKLSSRITTFLDARTHVAQWASLQKAMAVSRWPVLTYSPNLQNSVAVITFCASTITWIIFSPAFGGIVAAIVALLTGGFVFHIFQKIFEPYKKWVPRKYATCQDLLPIVTSSRHLSWTPEHIQGEVKIFVIEILGLPEDKYRLDADFIKDLGMD